MKREWIDISVPIRNGMVRWPGDPSVQISRTRDMEKGDPCTISRLSMGTHTGTHMDAPIHFLSSGQGIDKAPFSAILGRARVIEILDPGLILPEELKPHRLRKGERALFKTRNSKHCWKKDAFVNDFVSVSLEAAHYLVKRRVRTVGIDYLSVGSFGDDGPQVHRELLRGGIWIIEGLDLSGIPPGLYELLCLPLRIMRGDGAPARALLRSL